MPFRKLVTGFGAKVTVSEMIYARMLVKKNDRVEQARLRKGEDERCFGRHPATPQHFTQVSCLAPGVSRELCARAGVQIATKVADEALAAAKLAAASGASFLDLNCGCPIYGTTRARLVYRLTSSASANLSMHNGSPVLLTCCHASRGFTKRSGGSATQEAWQAGQTGRPYHC